MSFRFREWKVYKDVRIFRKEVKQKVISKIPKESRFELASQFIRALNSIVLNIAEGDC